MLSALPHFPGTPIGARVDHRADPLPGITCSQSDFCSKFKASVNLKSFRGLARTSDRQLPHPRNQPIRFESVSM